jgi:AAA+ superfamily predicted ATPase
MNPRQRAHGGRSAAGALDDAVSRLAGRLATALDALGGDEPAVGFLHGYAQYAPARQPADGTCLDLPVPGTAEPVHRLFAALRPLPLEIDLLVLAAAAHHHEGIASVLRGLHPEGRPWPTAGLAGVLAEAGALAAGEHGRGGARILVRTALTEGILVHAGVLALDGDLPFSERRLSLPPLLWETLVHRGDTGSWPAGCVPDLRPVSAAGLERWLAIPAVRAAGAAVQQSREVVIVAAAERPGAVASRLGALVGAAGAQPVVLHTPAIDDSLARQILVLAVARGQVPVVWSERRPDGPLPLAHLPLPLLMAVPVRDRTDPDGPVRSGTDEGMVEAWPRPVLEVPAWPLAKEDRHRAIAAELPEVALPGHAVGPATLEPRDVAMVAADLHEAAGLGAGAVDLRRLISAIDVRTAAAVPPGAVLVHPTAVWDDLVLPEDRHRQLREAVARVQAQDTVFGDWRFLEGREGRAGLRVLLSGPPGTGKTLAAEVLAGELGRDLLAIDLSRLVSKWLGETEKNLAAAFEAAERGGCALFFDEADALFGKRTEVGDARDRYANLETAYLLSRLERFAGVAILATNLRQNLDAAFARRLDFIVPFDPPDAAERVRLWRRHFPPAAPLAPSVDLERLAALYSVSGALIRNAAVAAAFLAASDANGAAVDGSGPIALHHVVHALRREYAKAGLAFPGAPAGTGSGGRPAAGTRFADTAAAGVVI